MELGQNRVWDYVGDNFVHRLVQTDGSDGKLVEAEGRCNHMDSCKHDGVTNDEKMDSIQLEYTYLLTSQLESQRRYFEEKIARVETNAQREIDDMVTQSKVATDEVKVSILKDFLEILQKIANLSFQTLKDQVDTVTKEKNKAEQKLTTAVSRVSKLVSDLKEEKQMNENLLHNQEAWQKKFNDLESQMSQMQVEKDKEIQDLKVCALLMKVYFQNCTNVLNVLIFQEQIRDVMFYLEAQNKVDQSPLKDEIQQGEVSLPSGSTPKNGLPRGKGRSKRGGR